MARCFWCSWVHWGMFRYLGLNKTDFVGKPSFSGNTAGFMRDSAADRLVLQPLVDCAQTPECIAPKSSSLGDHRYDQRWEPLSRLLGFKTCGRGRCRLPSLRRDVSSSGRIIAGDGSI